MLDGRHGRQLSVIRDWVVPVLGGVAFAFAMFAVGCGGGKDAAIAKNASDSADDQLQLQQLCAEDAGMCVASQVRALSRGAFCSDTSSLFILGQPIPDAGIKCRR
jgi:hypothetical protein